MSGVLQTKIGGITKVEPLPPGIKFFFNTTTDISNSSFTKMAIDYIVKGTSSALNDIISITTSKTIDYGSSSNHSHGNPNDYYYKPYSSGNETSLCTAISNYSPHVLAAAGSSLTPTTHFFTSSITVNPIYVSKRGFYTSATCTETKLKAGTIFFTDDISLFSSGSYTRLSDINEEHHFKMNSSTINSSYGTSYGSPATGTLTNSSYCHGHGGFNTKLLTFTTEIGSDHQQCYRPACSGTHTCSTTTSNRVVSNINLLRVRLAAFVINVDMTPKSGMIFMFNSTGAIPAGYVLCDGNNGTPNIIDRYAVVVPDTMNANVGQQAGTSANITQSWNYNKPATTFSHNHQGGAYNTSTGCCSGNALATESVTTTCYAENSSKTHSVSGDATTYRRNRYIMKI